MIIVLLPNNSDCGLANICFRVYNMTIECVVASGYACVYMCVCVKEETKVTELSPTH